MEEIKALNERKKKYLRQYLKHKNRVNRIEAEIEELRSMKMHPSQNNDGMPRGSNQSDLSSYAAVISGMEDELYHEGVGQVKTYMNISEEIKKIDVEEERDVLFYRYIKGKQFWEIAQIMNYSESWIHELHGKALKKLEIPKEWSPLESNPC